MNIDNITSNLSSLLNQHSQGTSPVRIGCLYKINGGKNDCKIIDSFPEDVADLRPDLAKSD